MSTENEEIIDRKCTQCGFSINGFKHLSLCGSGLIKTEWDKDFVIKSLKEKLSAAEALLGEAEEIVELAYIYCNSQAISDFRNKLRERKK